MGRAPAVRTQVLNLPTYSSGSGRSPTSFALASNESHFDPLPAVIEALSAELRHVNRYPDAASILLRERLAERLGVDVAEVVVGPGSAGVLQQIITAVCNPGDEAIYAWRSFEAYPILLGLAGARCVPVPLREGEWHDLGAMADAVTDRTRLVLLCSPNNPTGVSITGAQLGDFLLRVPPHVLVVIDEAYVEYTSQADPINAVEAYRSHPNVCVVRTFSKAHGLAGLRVGYAVASPDLAAGLRRTAMPFSVSGFAQRAAIASLDAEGEMSRRVAAVAEERSRMVAAARDLGWKLPSSEANFIWLRASDGRRRRLSQAFATADIATRDFVGDGIRVTIADRLSNDRVLGVLADQNGTSGRS